MRAVLREWVMRLAGVFGRARTDRDLDRELQAHLELAEEDLRRQGMSPDQAAREARLRFGHPTQTIETLRDQRGFPPLSAFGLDVKLGLRMLRKQWGLTLVGGLAMTIAIAVAASFFDFLRVLTGTTLPLPEGDRVVVIQPWNPVTRGREAASVEDFQRWREALRSVVDVGAFRTIRRNLIADSDLADPVRVAEISAAGFRVARVAPLVGRFFTEEDERAGASPVVVIGYHVWKSRFAADRSVVGRRVALDGRSYTVIGVMPRAFAFPGNHQLWTPLERERGDVTVFARLAPGVPLEGARAEVAAIGLLPNTAGGPVGAQLQPRVVPFIIGMNGEANPLLGWIPALFVLLLVPPCANVAVLIYARAVARQGEFAARLALGASRGRIVGQIFIEALLLALGAASLALVLASTATEMLTSVVALGDRPFWLDFSISYQTVLFVAGLAVVAAFLAGGLPALRLTRRWKLSGLHALNRSTAPRLGKGWTAAVVAQVALSVAIVPMVAEFTWSTLRPGIVGPGFNAQEFLSARVAMNARGASDAAERFDAIRGEMVRQLRLEPGVTAVTTVESAPFEERGVSVEVYPAGAGNVDGDRKPVSFNQVDAAFFDAFQVPLLTGRHFTAGDLDPGGAILVNRTFARRILGEGNPLGRRLRVTGAKDQPSEYEIVGVVGDLFTGTAIPTIYRPLAPAAKMLAANQKVRDVRLILHIVPNASQNPASRIRQIAAALDPALHVDDVQTLGEIYSSSLMPGYIVGTGIAGLVVGLVLFAVAGIYTLAAFAVVQRRREIGIRSALGASPLRLVTGIFRSVLIPISVGAGIGGVAAISISSYLSPMLFAEGEHLARWIRPAAELCVLLIGILAVLGPARRVLRMDVHETIRSE
jgi:putative ABC transport system permease protein